MRKGKKLLVASIGVAAISYACNKDSPKEPVGNLRGPVTQEPVGNLRPPEPPPDASPGPPPPPDAGPVMHHPVGNLKPPPPRDAGTD